MKLTGKLVNPVVVMVMAVALLGAITAGLTFGDTATLKVLRGSKQNSFDVKIGERPITLADVGKPRPEKETDLSVF